LLIDHPWLAFRFVTMEGRRISGKALLKPLSAADFGEIRERQHEPAKE
jgi:hypothetical protein